MNSTMPLNIFAKQKKKTKPNQTKQTIWTSEHNNNLNTKKKVNKMGSTLIQYECWMHDNSEPHHIVLLVSVIRPAICLQSPIGFHMQEPQKNKC